MGDEAIQATSDWMAVMRDMEHRRADAYLRDPHAHLLAGEPAVSEVEYGLSLGGPMGVVIGRGRFGDAVIERAMTDGVRQVVGLGAGSDTRPWRLDLPRETAWYEVDLPGQLDGKNAVFDAHGLTVRCRRTCVDADLRGAWEHALAAAGHDPAHPTTWLAEGLFYYLDRDAALAITDTVTELSAPGSHLVFDVPHPGFVADRAEFAAYMADRGVPFVGSADHPAELLADPAWHTEAYRAPDLEAGRCPWLEPMPHRLAVNHEWIWYAHATR
ncbi:class I SAM-dependent methyltransferase [Yinghuangia seranimata]|uniref:class I SAM-dependent methyltransferase n=1 Tax=Yinghuangia seranimata TaxID=408067 RepID=UPI00248BAFE4|nr:SAM-dependent methyltransferase [Yinghuangia seranimata]MDI2130721.1 SAM-dependent methyltransferase [Yinghuangia seranimata]